MCFILFYFCGSRYWFASCADEERAGKRNAELGSLS